MKTPSDWWKRSGWERKKSFTQDEAYLAACQAWDEAWTAGREFEREQGQKADVIP